MMNINVVDISERYSEEVISLTLSVYFVAFNALSTTSAVIPGGPQKTEQSIQSIF